MGTFHIQNKKDLVRDLLSGVIIALVSIPVSMGYARIAGLPLQYGLYGSLLPILAFGILTSSRHFVFGVDAAPAALTGSLIASMGLTFGSADAVAVMPFIAILAALWLWTLWTLGAGKYIRFISEAVLGGCVSGIATVVILMQLPGLFGGEIITGRAPALFAHLSEQTSFHWPSFLLGFGTVALILLFRRLFPRISMSVVLMAVGILMAAVFHIDQYGVKLLGAPEPGLPSFAIADVRLLEHHFGEVLLDTFLIALVILSETLLGTREIALHHDEEIDNQREILAYAVGNMVAAAFGSCPVGGSISRTKRAVQFHVSSQWMSVSAGAFMALFLLFGTNLLALLPVPILTGIVIASLAGLQEFGLAAKLWKVDRSKFVIFTAAFAAEFFGLTEGVLVGAVLSFAAFTVSSSRQPRYFLGCLEGEEGFFALSQTPHARPIRHTILYQFNGAVFYANIDDFVKDIENALRDDVRLVVVSGITDVDVTAAERILTLYRKLKKRGVDFYLAGHVTAVNEQLIAFDAEELIREGAVKARFTEALAAGGLTRPYPLEHTESGVKPDNTIPEGFTWAYGKYAAPRLENLAQRLAEEMLSGGRINDKRLALARRELAGEYWNTEDEEEFLDLLEMSLAVAVWENRGKMKFFRRLSQELMNRRVKLEHELAQQGDVDAARIFLQTRLRRESEFYRRYPEAGKLMARQRGEYMRALRREDPGLAALIEDLSALPGAESSLREGERT